MTRSRVATSMPGEATSGGARRRQRGGDDAQARDQRGLVAAEQVEAVAVDRGHVGAAVEDRIDDGPLPDEGAQHGRVELGARRRPVRQEVEARRIVARVRVLGGIRDGAAERVRQILESGVGAHDEVGHVVGPTCRSAAATAPARQADAGGSLGAPTGSRT